MRRSLLALVLLALLSGGCSLIVEDTLQNKTDTPDSGPTGPACTQTPDCLQIADIAFDCTQVCVGASPGHPGVCTHGMRTPDGTVCGMSGGARICVNSDCVMRTCGDGYLDRLASPPEYCDDGANNGPSARCHEDCTRQCGAIGGMSFPTCTDNDPCNGAEDCVSNLCVVTSAPLPEGAECMAGGQAGTCHSGVCSAN